MPKIVDYDAQREEVLLATWRTIDQHGVAGTTVRRIADEAGVSTGFVTHYFRDKNEVLAEALRLSNERSTERVLSRIEGLRGLAAVRAAIDAVLPLDEDRRLEWLIWLSFWGRAAAGDALGREQRRGRSLWRSTVERALGAAREAGEVRADLDLDYEVERIVVLVGGIGLQSQRRATPAFAEKAGSIVDDHLKGLAPGHP